MKTREWEIVGLAVLIPVLWTVYFCVCAAPAGAPFIYADF